MLQKVSLRFLKLSSLTIILFIISSNLFSTSFAQIKEDEDLEKYSKAVVTLDGRKLFYVRGISSFPADERAQVISQRLEAIAQDLSISPDSIEITLVKNGDEITAGGLLIMNVYDSDAHLEGTKREMLSLGVKKRVTFALNSYRYERTSEALFNKSFHALGAVTLAMLFLFLIHVIMKKVNSFLEVKLKTKIETLESKSFQLIRSNQIWITFYGLIKTIKFVLVVLIIFFTAQYSLNLFPWTRFIAVSLFGLFVKPLGAFGMALLNFIPNLAFLIVIFFIAKYLLKLLKLLFNGLGQGAFTIAGFDAEWALPTYKIVRILLVAFAVIVAYPYIPGSESAAFKGVTLFIGVLFSLGSSSFVGNLVAGYTMTYRKTYRIGDLIKIDNYIGQVMDVKLFVTRLRTPKNEEIIVPNSLVLNGNVTNYSSLSAEKGLILHTTVGIGYETPWRQVEEMLKLAAERTESVLKNPAPFVLQKSLGDFAVNYELNVYTNEPLNMMKNYTALHQNILDVFNENNIQIMTPAYEGDPETPKVVPKDQWFTPVAGKSEGEK
jgi:small-conductance mechanosensitive channel